MNFFYFNLQFIKQLWFYQECLIYLCEQEILENTWFIFFTIFKWLYAYVGQNIIND